MLADDSMTPCRHFPSCVSYIFLTEVLLNRKICLYYLPFIQGKETIFYTFF